MYTQMRTKYLVPFTDGHTTLICFVQTRQYQKSFGVNERVWITVASLYNIWHIGVTRTLAPSMNIDDNMRYHINGSRHHWIVSVVWYTIDMTAFGRHFRTFPLAHRPAHLKFVIITCP